MTSANTAAEHTPSAPSAKPWDPPLPRIDLAPKASDTSPVDTLDRLSKKGKLPGFRRRSDTTFEIAAHGTVYDRTLTGTVSGSNITFTSRLNRKFPAIMITVMAIALFPGLPLTHTMLRVFFGWYPTEFWITAAWYLPLTLLAIPTLIKQFKASERASRLHAEETIQKLAAHLGGKTATTPTD